MDAFRKAVERVMADRGEDDGRGENGGDGDDDDDYRQLDCALMASVQKQLTEVADAVDRIRPLAELSDPEKRECAKTSAVRRFPAKSVVFVLLVNMAIAQSLKIDPSTLAYVLKVLCFALDVLFRFNIYHETSLGRDDDRNSGETDAYFVLDGRCACVQRLNVRKTTAFGRDRYALVRTQAGGGGGRESAVTRDRDGVHTVYVKTSDLRPGSVFGLGERSSGRIVIATTDVKCLLVPLAFLTKHNASNVWGRTVCSLNASNPTEEQSFRKFVVDKRWEEYQRSLVDDIFHKHGSTRTRP